MKNENSNYIVKDLEIITNVSKILNVLLDRESTSQTKQLPEHNTNFSEQKL